MSYHIAPNPHATFASSIDQTIVNPTLAQVVTFDTTINSRGITLVSGSRMTLPQAGNYSFAISAVAAATGAANEKQVSMWFRKNGTDVANSNTYLSVGGNVPTVISVVLDLPCTTAGDYYEIWWSGETTSVKLDAVGAITGTLPATFPPEQPASPSIIVTIGQIG